MTGRILTTAVLLSAFGVFGCTQAMGEADSCPLKTAEEWQHFLEQYSSNPKWVETCEDSPCDRGYYDFVKTQINETFVTCSDLIAQHPVIDHCTSHLRRFTRAWLRQHDSNSYGFNASNPAYLAAQEAADKPKGMMVPPQAIIDALPDRGRVEAAARSAGIHYLTHNSALGGTRTFIFAPDPQGRFDQWLLLNLQDGQGSVNNHTPLSMITVQKKDAFGNKLARARLHFRDYAIARISRDRYGIRLNQGGNGKCYSCHSNGVRQLIARRTPVLEAEPVRGEIAGEGDFAYRRLWELNERLRSYGSPDWNGMIAPEDHGPALGRAQGCTDCHNGESRGALTVSSSLNQIAQKTLYELNMPYDSDLSGLLEKVQLPGRKPSRQEKQALEKAFEQRDALTQEIEDSRLPELKKWLLELPCSQLTALERSGK